MSVSSVLGSATIVIVPAASLPRMPAGMEAIDGDGIADGGGKVTVRGTTSAIASTPCTPGRLVVTEPGRDASENDHPPPTARIGFASASARWIVHAMSPEVRGKCISSAMYAWVFDQFCHQWFRPKIDAMVSPRTPAGVFAMCVESGRAVNRSIRPGPRLRRDPGGPPAARLNGKRSRPLRVVREEAHRNREGRCPKRGRPARIVGDDDGRLVLESR